MRAGIDGAGRRGRWGGRARANLDGVRLLGRVGGDDLVVVAQDRALEVGEVDGDRRAGAQAGTDCVGGRGWASAGCR